MIRVAAVDYLNARPLVAGMERPPLDERFRLTFATPAECARRLLEGQADLALIPSIEYARAKTRFEIVPGIEGLCHISELAEGRVEKTEAVLNRGDITRVKLLSIDEKGRLRHSRKAALAEEAAGGGADADESKSEEAQG